MNTYGSLDKETYPSAAESRSYGISKTSTLPAADIVMFLLISDKDFA